MNLKKSGLTVTGTLRKNKQYIPKTFLPNRSREELSSIFGFTKSLTLVSYVPKTGKAVILLSSMHHSKEISVDNQHKPEIILFYNTTKGGTDVMDKMAANYSCKRKTNRWPLAFFANTLDVCGIAAFLVYTKLYPKWNEKKT